MDASPCQIERLKSSSIASLSLQVATFTLTEQWLANSPGCFLDQQQEKTLKHHSSSSRQPTNYNSNQQQVFLPTTIFSHNNPFSKQSSHTHYNTTSACTARLDRCYTFNPAWSLVLQCVLRGERSLLVTRPHVCAFPLLCGPLVLPPLC